MILGRGLGGTAATDTAATTGLTTAGEVTAGASLATGAVPLESATAAAATSGVTTGGRVVAATVGGSLGAAGLNDNVLAVDGVRVGGGGSLVASDSSELDEGAVLAHC